MDHCFPEWDIWTQFVTTDFSRAMNLDALHNRFVPSLLNNCIMILENKVF